MTKIDSMISLAAKSGKIISGTSQVIAESNKIKKMRLIIIATDIEESTKKAIKAFIDKNHIPFIEYGTKYDLGHYIGKSERSMIAILDENFAREILKLNERS